jgi:hypothetical protein
VTGATGPSGSIGLTGATGQSGTSGTSGVGATGPALFTLTTSSLDIALTSNSVIRISNPGTPATANTIESYSSAFLTGRMNTAAAGNQGQFFLRSGSNDFGFYFIGSNLYYKLDSTTGFVGGYSANDILSVLVNSTGVSLFQNGVLKQSGSYISGQYSANFLTYGLNEGFVDLSFGYVQAGLTGATGPSGSSGTSGTSGATGATGSSGSSGTSGNAGPTGATGSTGSIGATGPTGSSFSSPYTGNIQINGQAWVTADANGNTTSSTTVNWNDGNVQTFTLNAATTTFTFSNGNAGATYILVIRQNASGAQTITWPAAVAWAGASTPIMTSTASRYDIYTFIFDGTKYFGSYVQNFT